MKRLALEAYTKVIRVCGKRLPVLAGAWSLVGAAMPTALAQGAAPTAQLTPDQQAIVDKIAKPAAPQDTRYAGAPSDIIGAQVTLPLADGQSVTLVKTRSVLQKDGSVIWHGEVPETGERAMLMLWSNALLTGYFVFNGKIFTVESLGGGVNAFAEMDRRRLPADHPDPGSRRDSVPLAGKEHPAARPAAAEPTVAPFADSERQALEAKKITIDVMVLYTANVAKRYVRDPADLLALAIEEANATFRNSGLGNVTLRLVHTELIEYDETEDDQFTHLYTMVDGLGPFGSVAKLRDEKHAD